MKILEKEIGLREETRAAQNLREAVEAQVYQQRTDSLAATQAEIAGMNADVLRDISKLEAEKGATFPTEKNMLRQVGNIMGEVEQLLSAHETDAPTIAAETEIIELLLKVQRKQPPKQKSKGNAGSQPGAGGEGDTEESALALIGRGDEAGAQRIERTTEQTSGTITAGYPSEYRTGLDAYFRELESAAN